jgi:hypothetical protein
MYFLINKRENRLTFYDFNKKRKERESINLPFVFFKEGRREGERKREKQEIKEEESTSAPLFKGLETDPSYLTLEIYKRPLLSKGGPIVY